MRWSEKDIERDLRTYKYKNPNCTPGEILPFLDKPYPEHWIVRVESPEGSPKYAYLVKGAHLWKGKVQWTVDEVDPGFITSDPMLQELINNYLSRKNDEELDSLCNENQKETIIGKQQENAWN